jgi:hypothetical protein
VKTVLRGPKRRKSRNAEPVGDRHERLKLQRKAKKSKIAMSKKEGKPLALGNAKIDSFARAAEQAPTALSSLFSLDLPSLSVTQRREEDLSIESTPGQGLVYVALRGARAGRSLHKIDCALQTGTELLLRQHIRDSPSSPSPPA